MERLTTNKSVSDMGMFELAHNCCYIAEDGTYRYRDYEMDMDQRELVRELMKQLAQEDMPSNPILFDETMMDYLALNPCQDVSGLIALLYHNMWAMADLREKLKRYEDAEEQGLLLRLPCKVGDTAWYVSRSGIHEVEIDSFAVNINLFVNVSYYIGCERFGKTLTPYKTLFFSREEAEAKLAEIEGSHAENSSV